MAKGRVVSITLENRILFLYMLIFCFISVSASNAFGSHGWTEVEERFQNETSFVPWYEEKNHWALGRMTVGQLNYVKKSVKGKRLINTIIPRFLIVRPSGSLGNRIVRLRIANYLKRSLNWDVEYDSFLDKPPRPYHDTQFVNVIATLNPDAKRRLVLACHYDSKITPKNFLGATDSAVPCSMMIEIAIALRKVLKLSRYSKDLTLQLIFFDGEEAFVSWSRQDSLYGSRHLALKWSGTPWPQNDPTTAKTMLDSIDLLTLLDLLGASNPKFYDSSIVPSRHFSDLIRIERELYGQNIYFQDKPKEYLIEDDHIPFLVRDVSTLHVIPMEFPPEWHTMKDDAAHLDHEVIERLTEIMAVFVSQYLYLDIPEVLRYGEQ